MREEPIDFIQFTYNLNDREVEERLLPMAAERRSRPSSTGPSTAEASSARRPRSRCRAGRGDRLRAGPRRSSSGSSAHPAVTCAIPATSKVAHVRENVRALKGPLPDAALRKRIADDYARA
jgi:aryl-alcohol dehydrogenase-like predicted oxidoreductase